MAIKDIENITLKDCVVKWAIVHKPRTDKLNPTAGPMFTVSVALSQERFDKLKAKGLHPNTQLKLDEEDGRRYMKLKAKALTSEGKPNPVFVLDKDDNPLTDLIGNGSKCDVFCSLIKTTEGTAIIRLKGLQVLDLVKFQPEMKPISRADFDDGDII